MKPEETTEYKATYGDLYRKLQNIAHRSGIKIARTTASIEVQQRMRRVTGEIDKLLGELAVLRDTNVSISNDLPDSLNTLRQRFGAVNKIVCASEETNANALKGGFDALDPNDPTNHYRRAA